jgi:hypothetical protein
MWSQYTTKAREKYLARRRILLIWILEVATQFIRSVWSSFGGAFEVILKVLKKGLSKHHWVQANQRYLRRKVPLKGDLLDLALLKAEKLMIAWGALSGGWDLSQMILSFLSATLPYSTASRQLLIYLLVNQPSFLQKNLTVGPDAVLGESPLSSKKIHFPVLFLPIPQHNMLIACPQAAPKMFFAGYQVTLDGSR